ncbi:nuclear transport factor 2 family protein [candidate division KSB1 bacterium]|nr:nuclear transport factor 2 family protein [candidate division KSB1 bacterium]
MRSFRYVFLVLMIANFIGTFSCQQGNHTLYYEMDRQHVESVIHNSIGWAKDKDINLLYSIVDNDTNYIEVHPNDRIVRGFQDFKKSESFWMSDDFKAIRYEIRDLKINFSNAGDVAWFCCILDDINEWKGQPANWENTRWTGVLEKRNKSWIIMQMHFSFACY